MRVSAAPAKGPEALSEASVVSGVTSSTSWDAIAARVTRLAEGSIRPSSTPSQTAEQLSGLLKLQVDVSRYQLRVELLSKVSESAVASVRKLQQNQ